MGAQAGGEKLAAIGLDEIDVKAGPDRRVAGRALGEKKHGEFAAHGIGIVNLAKEFARIGKLRFEFGENLFTDGVTAEANAGADGGDQVLRAGAECETHAADAGFDNTFKGPAPAGVEGGDGALLAIGDEDGNAIGGLNGEEQAGVRGDLSVGLVGARAGGVGGNGANDQVGMKLAKGDQGGFGIGCDGLGEEAAIALNDRAVVGLGEAEVEFPRHGGLARNIVGAVGAGEAAFAGGKSCIEPGKIPAGDGKPHDAIGGADRDGGRQPEFVRRKAFRLRGPDAGTRVEAALAHNASLSQTGVEGFDGRWGFLFLAGSRGHRSVLILAARNDALEKQMQVPIRLGSSGEPRSGQAFDSVRSSGLRSG